MPSSSCIKSQPVFTETLLPFLDTVYRVPHTSRTPPSSHNTSQKEQARFKKNLKQQFLSPHLRIEEFSIYEVFANFVAAFTGQSELAFYASFQSLSIESARHSVVCARVAEDNSDWGTNSLILEFCEYSPLEVSLDFYFQVNLGMNHKDQNDTIKFDTPFVLALNENADCPAKYELVLRYEESLISMADAKQIFNAALSYFMDSSFRSTRVTEQYVEKSILNFPPLTRPPLLVQDKELGNQEHPALLHAAFERRALEHPERIALDFLQSRTSLPHGRVRRTFTYAGLNHLTTLLAEKILACVRQGDITNYSKVVPIFLSTSAELYISYLAVLKAGLAFSPLPIEAPDQRLRDILEDLNPHVIIGAPTFQERLPALISDSATLKELQWIDVEAFTLKEYEGKPKIFVSPQVVTKFQEDDVAYIMYTSGSTGKPKGVQITHLASTCSIAAHAVCSPLPVSADGVPRWFQFAAPTFDPSLMEIFVTLSTGATLCSASRDLMLTDLEAAVSELGASVMMATPSMAALLHPSKLNSLQSLWTMGETLLRKNINDFAKSSSSCRDTELVNAYGPTEAAINCTLLTDFHLEDRGSIIGPALSTSSLFVIDPLAKVPTLVPRGFSGELAIGGPQVSIGYINRPEQNIKSFVTSCEFGRLYRTGDKVRIVTDRNGQHVVEFLGRLDTLQVKLSGRRVDLGEIDTVLSSSPGVVETITVSYKRNSNQHGSEEAVAFVVAEKSFDKNSVEVNCQEATARLLPPYMCPSKYIFLTHIPRSLAGKVDRKKLSGMVEHLWHEQATQSQELHTKERKSDHDSSISEEEDSIEITLRHILTNIVGGDAKINSNTNFLSVGIDSLYAIRYLQQARDADIVELTIVDILRSATTQTLAKIVMDRRVVSSNKTSYADEGSNSQSSIATSQRLLGWKQFHDKYEDMCAEYLDCGISSIERILPTTPTQSGMLTSFLRSSARGENHQKHYIHHSVHHIKRSIDISKLQDSWISVLNRHEAYRMVFLPVDDSISPFIQCVLRPSAALAQISWTLHHCETDNQDDVSDLIEASILLAEASIALDKPPYSLTLITTPTHSLMLVSMFHGIFDGASLQLLFDEVAAEYRGNQIPRRVEISTAVDMHYNSDGQSAIDFWSTQLKNCDPMPFPPLTGLRPERVTRIPKTSTILATPNLDTLRTGARKSLATPLAILQAAWALLLVTYKGSLSSSTFGSVISGRLDQDSEICIGPTFTTVPVTISAELLSESSLTSNATVLQSLSQVNAMALEHLQIPLNAIVAPTGGLFYDTLLAWQDFASGTKDSDIWHTVDYPAMGNDFAVMIEVWPESNGTLRLRATYTDEHLDGPSASLMLRQFDDMIAFILKNPETPFLHGRFAPTPSQSPLMASYSASGELLHALFEENARINPRDIALVFVGDLKSKESASNIEWTYAELDEKANYLAKYLVSRFGYLNDLVIPFCIEKSPELYVAVLGILKAGAAWCPIDPTFPISRRHDLIVRTDAKMLLVANQTVLQESAAVPESVAIVDISNLGSEYLDKAEILLLPPRPQDMAYLIWTSGTTGLPKGVQVEHSAVAESMRSLQNCVSKGQDEHVRMLQFSQPTFDVFVQDLFYTWGVRGTVISATKGIILGEFASLSNQTKATHAHLTPAFATIIPRKQCKTLQVVTFIGEALPQAVADDWGQDMIAYNTYGPAEVSVVSTIKQFAGCSNDFKSVNIGFTLPSVMAFVISNNNVVTKNGVGELALAGPQVARGYWKDVSKTQERFTWNQSAGSHIYLTGDIVRQLHDGSFEFVGRRDDLVKLNGQRVELSEISFALSNCHPDIEQVLTMYIGRSDRSRKVVVAFLSVPSLSDGENTNTIIITNPLAAKIANVALIEARKSLPDHMVPSVFIVVKNVPVTASAKIDRKALSNAYEMLNLQKWEQEMLPEEALSWTDTENILINHISSFLGIPLGMIGKMNRIAALGIDSISAIRLTARLKAIGYLVSISDLLQCKTVGDICAVVELRPSKSVQPQDLGQIFKDFNSQWLLRISEYLGKDNTAKFTVCPPLPLQENILSESFRNYESYWSNHFFELSGDLDLNILQESWKQIASQNEALRAGFVPTAAIAGDIPAVIDGSTFIQIIYETQNVDWSYVKVDDHKFTSRCKERAQKIALYHQQNSFLRPCWAVTIFDRGDSRTMMFTIHHSIHDGLSLRFIMEDLNIIYKGITPVLKRNNLLNAIATSIKTRGNTEQTTAFWETALKEYVVENEDASQTSLRKPTGYNTVATTLSVSHTNLKAASQKLESSVTSVLRAAWSCMAIDYLEINDKKIVIGEVLSERRMDSILDDVIGPLVSMIAAPLSAIGTTRDILSRDNQAAAWQYRNVNPGIIRRFIKRAKNQALYPAVFVFHPRDPTSENISVLNKEELWVEAKDHVGLNVEEDLTLNVEERVDGYLDLVISAEKSVLSLERVEMLAQQLDALIAAMITFPDVKIADLTNHFPDNLISRTIPRNPTVSDIVAYENPLCWFEHWARVCPDWSAVEIAEYIGTDSSRTISWSYAQLNEEANRVRDFIQLCGVHGRTIGMCLGRTLASFAVILGIFKSGNTYLPIDEDLPADRKSFLLQDSSSAIFFTTGSFGIVPKGCRLVDIESDRYQSTTDLQKTITLNRDDPAYLLYTSGSTGNPKGVLISSENLTSFCEAQSEFICAHCPETHKLGGIGKYMGLASRAFDVHVGEMFLAWRWGLCCVTAKRALLLDDLRLALKELHVTHASFVPSLLDQVGLIPSDVPLLKYLGVGGEKISQRTLEVWGDSNSVALINAYGPTEVTIGCCSARVSSKSNMRNIGKPLGDLVAHVMIPGTFTYVKRGMEGELCITGSLVGIGYHNRENGAFVQNFHGAKMYRTGDLVRLMNDDSVEIFGRADDQTKIRGQRLELGEVSECVRALSTVNSDVATIITQHPDLSRLQLVSFIAQSKSSTKDEKAVPLHNYAEINLEVRSGCRAKLPAYMVPDIVIPLNFLPLAATSGKADTKQLKAIFANIPLHELLAENGASSAIIKAIRELNEVEKAVVEILAGVVHKSLPDVGPSTNIFEIGVDSLVAISLSTRMRTFGYNCSVADILSIATVEELALLPRNSEKNENIADATLARQELARFEEMFRDSLAGKDFGAKVAAVRPCLPVQEAIVARSLNQNSESLYVNHIILELGENISIPRLQDAWKASAKDNDILRTCFYQVKNDILQVVLTNDTFQISWEEQTTSEIDSIQVVKDMRDEIAKDIMDKLQNTPPLRINLLRSASSNASSLLCISIHHALYDAQSLNLLMEDVYLRYMSQELPMRPSSGALVEYVASQNQEESKAYWMKMLKDYKPETLVNNFNATNDARTSERVLKSSLSSLESCASRLHVTLPTLAQVIFGLAFAKANSLEDFVFGLVMSGRSVPVADIETLLAPSITTVPQRIDMRGGDATVLEILSSIQKSSGQLLRFQHTSLRAVHRWVEADRPLFDCLFSYITSEENQSYDHLWKELDNYMPLDYPFAIEFEASAVSDTLVLRAGYTSEFSSQSKMESLLEMMELLIETLNKGETFTVKSLGIRNSKGHNFANDSSPQNLQKFPQQELKIKETILSLVDLESEHISRQSTFFRLGIDSVIAIRFAQKLRSVGFDVSSSDVIRHPSIALLSEYISTKNQDQVPPPSLKQDFDSGKFQGSIPLLTTDDHISEIYECTPLQTGLLTQTIANEGWLYIHHPAVQLAGGLDVHRLKAAWFSVVELYDILRTSFHYIEDSEVPWIAAVHEKTNENWTEIEASESVEETIKHIVQKTVFPTMDSFSKPPVQVTIIKSSQARFLVISIHHSLYDGWSLPLIFEALSKAYQGDLKSPKTPFFHAAKLITQNQASSVRFWSDQLDKYKGIKTPSSIPLGPNITSFSTICIGIPASEVLEKCRTMDMDLQSVSLLAYAKALCCLVKRRDIVFGHVISGRSLPLEDVENIVGPLFNTIPHRVYFKNSLLSNQDLATQVQQSFVQGQIHQHASLNTIQNLWRKGSDDSDMSLVDALFVFQRSAPMVAEDLNAKLWKGIDMEEDRDATEYGLNFEMEQGECEINLSASSPAGRLSSGDLRAFCRNFEYILRDILDSPSRSVVAYPETFADLPLSFQVEMGEYENFQEIDANLPALKIIREALSEVSEVPTEKITLQTSIYALGIDSIAAIRVGSISRRRGVIISVADVLQGRCLGGIVRLAISKFSLTLVNDTHENDEIVPTDIITKITTSLRHYQESDIEQVLPCLAGQVYHLASWLKSGRTTYEPTWAFSFNGKLDIDRLQSTWRALQIRHPILRTIFLTLGSNNAYQIILKPTVLDDATFATIESIGSLEETVKNDIRKSARDPSTLFTPPISIRVVRGSSHDAVLIKLHHSLYDAWTMGSLISELSALYLKNTALLSNPSFPAFVKHIENVVNITEEASFWKSSLSRAQRTILVSETPKTEIIPQPALKQTFVWIKEGVKGLDKMTKVTRSCGLALNTIIILAFGRALAEKTQTTNPTFGFFQVGRSASFPDAIKLSGPCVNLLPISTSVAQQESNLDTALAIQEDLSKRVPYEQSHLRKVLSWKQGSDPDNTETSSEPLFNASLNILWHGKDTSKSSEAKNLLEPMFIGVPTDFASEEAIPGETAVDGLDTRYLAAQNLFCDVGGVVETDSLDFGVKADYSLMGEEQVRAFVKLVTDEIVRIVDSLLRVS